MKYSKKLDTVQLLNILTEHKIATAIYTGEEIQIEWANSTMLAAWGKSEKVIGMKLADALPEIADQPFLGMLKQVWLTGNDDIGKAIAAQLEINGNLGLYYFDYEYRAIKNENGEVYAILHTALDVTTKVKDLQELKVVREKSLQLEIEKAVNAELADTNEKLVSSNSALQQLQDNLRQLNIELESRVDERTRELSSSENRLRYLIMDAPIAIGVFKGRELVIETANTKILEAWGKTTEVIGKPLHIAMPELVGQGFLGILDEVFITGLRFHGHELSVMVKQNGELEEVFFNFVYQPLKYENGETHSIMVTSSVVTEQVAARQKVQDLNEELTSMNEELTESQIRLLELNKELNAREEHLNRIISELPTPVVVLIGPNQIISTTNTALLKFWRKNKAEVLGRPMLGVFPEIRSQPFPAMWKSVLDTGVEIVSKEQLVIFKDEITGEDRPVYVDLCYQPFKDPFGKRVGVLATILDVTEKVRSRMQIEEAESKLRLAIDSSELGTWYIDATTREFSPSPRLKQIFGFLADEEMPYEAAVNQILEEYREKVTAAVDNSISAGVSYAMEYPIIGYHDHNIRWVRATGKLYNTEVVGKPNFSGTIQDITERKLEEQRKDDFLNIASHELKTPITSLKGALQLLNRYKAEFRDPIVPMLIEDANASVETITSLINDLLNTARTNEGQLHLNISEFVVSDMINNSCGHIRMAGKHELVIEGDTSLRIAADENRIVQVVINLVNNAVKYAPDSLQIFLTIEKVDQMVKISVRDNGPGIPSDKLLYLFDRYYRVDYGGLKYSGLGLGLYISSEIVKRHGGMIGVKSQLGSGSTFWFTIPIER